MYLAYFEQIVAQTIVDLGGPADWALPFWNYSDSSNPDALNIPPAFTSPANETNSLWMQDRNNTINERTVTLKALDKKIYTSASSTEIGFGGLETAFHHGGGVSGALESLPHNKVHVDISGAMGDPNTAGLDPIFWLHHANIDRLWQVWLNQGNRSNPTSTKWSGFEFYFHDKDGKSVSLICEAVEDTRKILSGYTYEGVPADIPVNEEALVMTKLKSFPAMPLEVVTASVKAHSLTGQKSTVSLSLSSDKKSSVRLKGLAATAEVGGEPTRTLLRFENIKGKGLVPIHSVYINLPEGENSTQSYYAGSLALFGLENASTSDSHNSGSGLTEHFEITELMDNLRRLPNWSDDKLDVQIVPDREMSSDAEVTIGRISLYSE